MKEPIIVHVQMYCRRFGLNFMLRGVLDEECGDDEEWEGVLCAGVVDEVHLIPAIIMEDDGRVKVVTEWATPETGEDVWRYVTLDEMVGGQLHAE